MIERKRDRIFGDLIPFERAAVGRLKNEFVRAMAAVFDEAVATSYQLLRNVMAAQASFSLKVLLSKVFLSEYM